MLYGIIALAVLLCLCGGALIWTINKNTRAAVLNEELERQLENISDAKKQLDNENYRLSAENHAAGSTAAYSGTAAGYSK